MAWHAVAAMGMHGCRAHWASHTRASWQTRVQRRGLKHHARWHACAQLKEGKVIECYRKKWVIHVERANYTKKNGGCVCILPMREMCARAQGVVQRSSALRCGRCASPVPASAHAWRSSRPWPWPWTAVSDRLSLRPSRGASASGSSGVAWSCSLVAAGAGA